MDKINLLKNRRDALLKNGKETREKISALVDGESFVELSSYSFSKNEFYSDEEQGEGVITGFATIDGQPCYIVAQNAKVCSGGISKANCDKIVKALVAAENSSSPVVYLLESKGVQIGEGVNVLEGVADVLWRVSNLSGKVPQIAIVDGDVFGAFAALVASCDMAFYTKNACVSFASPAVLGATEKFPKTKEEVGGVKALANNGLNATVVEDLAEAKDKVSKVIEILQCDEIENGDDYNRTAPELNEKVCAKCLTKAIFDEGTYVEVGASFCPEVKTAFGTIGGMSVGAIVFDGREEGIEITANVMKKIKRFAALLSDYGLPLVNLVNAKGIAKTFEASQSDVLNEIAGYIYNTTDIKKLSLVYGKAVGMGYTLFAAKEMGYDYTAAFPDAMVSLFDTLEGAYIQFSGVTVSDEKKFEEKYKTENQDPFNAAKGGYIDNIIEPQFVRQHLIASLQMLVR